MSSPTHAEPEQVDELQLVIEGAFERRASLTVDEIEHSTRPAVERVIEGLESGVLRIAEPDGNDGWKVNEWLKKAVLLYFRTQDMELVEADPAPYWDKVPARFADRKSTRLNSSHVKISYAVFCLKKKR